MQRIHPGITGEQRRTVTEDIAIDFLGLSEARVLGTPYLIWMLEITARDSIKPLLEEGYDSVGSDVSVKHLAATPLGMEVRFRSEVVEVDGRRVRFRVEAHDDKEKIAEGTHERFVVNVQRFAERVESKRAEFGIPVPGPPSAQPGHSRERH
jgi:fluoroacetyl-CoA thioesterase